MLLLLPVQIISCFFVPGGIHPSLQDASEYGTVGFIYLTYLELCLGVFYMGSLVAIAWHYSWKLTIYYVTKARRSRTTSRLLMYLVIDYLIASALFRVFVYMLSALLFTRKPGITEFSVELALTCIAIASLLPTAVHLCFTGILIFCKLAESVLGPFAAQIILRVSETKKGVYSQIVLAVGIIAKLVQEFVKQMHT